MQIWKEAFQRQNHQVGCDPFQVNSPSELETRPNLTKQAGIFTSAGSTKSSLKRMTPIRAHQPASQVFLEKARTFLQVGSDHGQTEGQGRGWHKTLVRRAPSTPSFTELSISMFSQHTETLLTFTSRETTVIQFPTHSHFVVDISSV